MHHRSTATDSNSTLSHHEKNLSALVDNLKQRQLILKRDQIITSILEDAPRSFTKLVSKDLMGNNFRSEQRIKMLSKNVPPASSEVRAKHAQKNFFRALEEEQRLISRENMQMLGLTIQKISCLPKSKQARIAETSFNPLETVGACEVVNLENYQNIPYRQDFINQRTMSHHRPRTLKKRPQSIRVRGKESPQKRRPSLKPINSQYQNPIYEARIVSYRQLLFRLQWSYGLYSEMNSSEDLRSDRKYKVWIGGGNNSPLVRELMKRRFWWQITEQRGNYDVNFIWTQLKLTDYFQKQTKAVLWTANQTLQKPDQSKLTLVRSQSKQLPKRSKSKREREIQRQWLLEDKNLFKIMPEFEQELFKNSIRPYRGKELYERQKLMCAKQVTGQGQRVHNHFTSNFHLGNKKALFYNLKEYYDLTGGNLFKAIPLTFHIKKGMNDPQYKRFLAYYKKRQMHIKKQQKEMQNGQRIKRPLRNIWIVKPGELTNRGNGITVIDEVYELDSIMKSQKRHDNGTEKTFIVQLYIDRPFLYKRRKFDIRHYLMISQINGVFKAYWYKEGYIRTTSYEFDIFNLDREIHLTNDAVQKFLPHYGRYEIGNKVSYSEFQKYLDSSFKDKKQKYNFQEQILPKMKDITLDAVRSTFVKLTPERFKHNFQIFGLDFMIDSDFVPWLIEVNTNPCLELSSPLLTRLIPQMVDQALRLTLDVVFPPPTHYPNTAKHLVPDASLQSLNWELIFDERVEGQSLRQLYKHCRGDLMAQIGDISDDQVYEDTNNEVCLNDVLNQNQQTNSV